MGREIVLVTLNEQSLLILCDFERNKPYITRTNDASLIFQRITILFESQGRQATSKNIVKKCLLNLWSTWYKYTIEATSIHCFLIYLIQLYLINVASQIK